MQNLSAPRTWWGAVVVVVTEEILFYMTRSQAARHCHINGGTFSPGTGGWYGVGCGGGNVRLYHKKKETNFL